MVTASAKLAPWPHKRVTSAIDRHWRGSVRIARLWPLKGNGAHVRGKQMTNLVAGMKIEISEPVFAGSFRNPKFLGNRQIIGQIIKESYGNKRGQHTFTIDVKWAEGMYAEDVLQKKKIRRKGRNVYKNLVRVIDTPDNMKELEKEKSGRAKTAKDQKYWSWIEDAKTDPYTYAEKLDRIPDYWLSENPDAKLQIDEIEIA